MLGLYQRNLSWLQLVHFRRILSTQKNTQRSFSMKYTKTLNLPQSNFPMKHSRKLELEVEDRQKFENLFPGGQSADTTFILHDGPPYANGDAHFGHAINRILKDIFVKRKLLENFQVDYRPGWDCHGLPIEIKAFPPNTDLSTNVSALEIRSQARKLALDAIERQKRAFKNWFLSANWQKTYRTFDIDYSLAELAAFYSLYQKGLIFRDRLPVYWSPSTGTALAEAELQYRTDHISRSAFVKFPVIDANFDALIWTTTPWTLLANEAIAYSEQMNYCLVNLVQSNNRHLLLVAKENLHILKETFNDSQISIESESVKNVSNLKYKDPLSGEIRPFLPSCHVTSTKGTGLIHIAPNHGHEDYKLFRKHFPHKPWKESIVDEKGQLRLPDGRKLSIIDDNCASKYVLEQLLPPESVLFVEDYSHNYPYDWRSNRPVLILPSDQWFLNIDSIRNQCIDALQTVQFYPELLRKEMIHQLVIRPNWCLSRQRKYGVPIPVFYDQATNKPILNDQIFQAIMDKFRSDGLDVWWSEEPAQLLSKCPEINSQNLVKGQDILDIWFDSGCSWLAVLGQGPEKLSELYLEGVDQLRGWFQSSLITSVALRGYAPYRSLFIHGFALDKDGRKMSKSIGNVIDPMDIVDGKFSTVPGKNNTDCGVDGLRFWIAHYACSHNDVHVDIRQFNEDILTILNRMRNTLRFFLGYLASTNYPFSPPLKFGQFDRMKLLDKYQLYSLLKFHLTAADFYNQYQLSGLIDMMIFHFNYEISTFYITRIKDRLYCNDAASLDVQSIITVFYYSYHTMLWHMAPILPHIVMECHHELETKREGIIPKSDLNGFIQSLFSTQHIDSEQHLQKHFRLIFSIIRAMDEWAASKHRLIRFDCHLIIDLQSDNSNKIFQTLRLFQSSPHAQINSDLVECLQVAQCSYGTNQDSFDFTDWTEVPTSNMSPQSSNNLMVNGNTHSKPSLRILVRPTMNQPCPRCRRFTIIECETREIDRLCNRCSDYVKSNQNPKSS